MTDIWKTLFPDARLFSQPVCTSPELAKEYFFKGAQDWLDEKCDQLTYQNVISYSLGYHAAKDFGRYQMILQALADGTLKTREDETCKKS